MDKRTKMLLYIGGFFALVGFIIVMAILFPAPPRTSQEDITTLPSPTPNLFNFTEEEKTYPQATPQPFKDEEQTGKTGMLVVTSEPEDVIVLLDARVHQERDDPVKGQWPINKTPFSVSRMPVGEHSLLARKSGYVIAEETYNILPDQITRVHIKLIKLP